jgi:outer membrane protein assembly factor BamB
MTMKATVSLSLGFLLGLPFVAPADHWPAWRGPLGTGVTAEKNLPLRWSTNENVRWRVPLPDRGNSTPIAWGSRVFVTQAIAAENRRALLCFDRRTGRLLWQSGPTWTDNEPTHETNPQCAASPVTDGDRVIAWFGSAGLYCFDFAGRELWHRDLGAQRHIWGNASSPVLHGDLCFLNFGPGERTFLIAVNKRTGRDAWKVDEPGGDSGEKKPGVDKPAWIGSWSTPVVVRAGGREELIVHWPNRVAAFAPRTGRELWTCRGLTPLAYTSPLHADGVLVAMGGFMGAALAVKAGGSGDVTDTHRLWLHPKNKQRIGSGAVRDGHVYILTEPGVAECWELATGKLVYEERLKGPAPEGNNWSSLVLAGDRLYVINQGGDAFVWRASPKFEVLATNSVDEFVNASLAPSDGDIFIRTHKALWCVSGRK